MVPFTADSLLKYPGLGKGQSTHVALVEIKLSSHGAAPTTIRQLDRGERFSSEGPLSLPSKNRSHSSFNNGVVHLQ